MEEKNENDKVDEIMLPGFRFHPTDEELVGFYLRRKIQQRPPTVELIKQLDIYKYDPWDLPKLAATGEKEWYFYCPRDRKYRNSARPNRVTGAGFWKATGTDRPIYSSDDSKCIGLKKSLVFYKGRAAKGVKTDWMMHEFRLPSLTDSSPNRRYMDKSIPASDSWAICRIFKKTNSTAYRALSNSWVSPMPETNAPSHNARNEQNNPYFDSDLSLSAKTSSSIPFCFSQYLQQSCRANFSPIDYPIPSKTSQLPVSGIDIPTSFMFSPLEAYSGPAKCTVNIPSMFLNSVVPGDSAKGSELDFGVAQEKWNTLSYNLQQDVHVNNTNLDENPHANQTETLSNIGIPLSLPSSMGDNAWKPDMIWDSSSCPSEMSSSFSSTKCYT